MKISQQTIDALCETKPPSALPGARAFTAEIHELERELGLEPSRASFDMRANAQRLSELRILVSKLAQPAPAAAFTAPSAPSVPAMVPEKLHGRALFVASAKIAGSSNAPAPKNSHLAGRARMLSSMTIEGQKL